VNGVSFDTIQTTDHPPTTGTATTAPAIPFEGHYAAPPLEDHDATPATTASATPSESTSTPHPFLRNSTTTTDLHPLRLSQDGWRYRESP
jgi:hypothetical protein